MSMAQNGGLEGGGKRPQLAHTELWRDTSNAKGGLLGRKSNSSL